LIFSGSGRHKIFIFSGPETQNIDFQWSRDTKSWILVVWRHKNIDF